MIVADDKSTAQSPTHLLPPWPRTRACMQTACHCGVPRPGRVGAGLGCGQHSWVFLTCCAVGWMPFSQSRARSLPRRPLPRPRTAGGPRPGPGRRDGGCKFGTAAGSRTAATKLAVLVAQRSPRHCRTAEPQNRRITVLSPVWGRAWQNSLQNSRRGVWRT